MKWTATASVANGDGVFDAAYGFGIEAQVTGTPEEVAKAVSDLLASLKAEDCKAMEYGKPPFRIILDINPESEEEMRRDIKTLRQEYGEKSARKMAKKQGKAVRAADKSGTVVIDGQIYRAFELSSGGAWKVVRGNNFFDPTVALRIIARSAAEAIKKWASVHGSAVE